MNRTPALLEKMAVSLYEEGVSQSQIAFQIGRDRKTVYEILIRCGAKKPFYSQSIVERFFSHINKTNDCWEWLARKDIDGYGVFNHSATTVRAHRFSFENSKGAIPLDLVVMHSCDNPSCVNPEHLSVGTINDSNQDCKSKGRTAKGNNHTDKTHCIKGHEFNKKNTYFMPKGGRSCRVCSKLRMQKYRGKSNESTK